VITTEPNADLDELHNRMPVILAASDVETWINVTDFSPDERLALLRPAPDGTLSHYGVDKAVGSVRNDGPELIEPVEPQALF
jgi:putative SOS response-associated peptidase YedK